MVIQCTSNQQTCKSQRRVLNITENGLFLALLFLCMIHLDPMLDIVSWFTGICECQILTQIKSYKINKIKLFFT